MKPNKTNSKLDTLKGLNTLSSLLFYLAILIFIIGFNFTDSPPPSGWYQQFMPDLGGQNIVDITFLDSLNGYAITGMHYILKTTNRGDNWNIIYNDTSSTIGFTRVEFINQNTGFVSGGMYYNGSFHLLKTTNGGINWSSINTPVTQYDMFVLNEDTIWITDGGGLGGLFRTTNGGASWDLQYYQFNNNPGKIYMYNQNIGFACTSFELLKTTNSGMNWIQIGGSASNNAFFDMYFSDSLTGWKSNRNIGSNEGDTNMVKTTNGGLNWLVQKLPSGGLITVSSTMYKFSKYGKDTLFGCGGQLRYSPTTNRGIIYTTTNSGTNWLFQIPDTAFGIPSFITMNFINNKIGWAYTSYYSPAINGLVYTGIHTTVGGDTNLYTPVKNITSLIPKEFYLSQNYPNPFNPTTRITYSIKSNGKGKMPAVKLAVYDITGKQIQILINEKQNPGTYEVSFNGANLSSGVYFYSLFAEGILIDTKKMVLVK